MVVMVVVKMPSGGEAVDVIGDGDAVDDISGSGCH